MCVCVAKPSMFDSRIIDQNLNTTRERVNLRSFLLLRYCRVFCPCVFIDFFIYFRQGSIVVFDAAYAPFIRTPGVPKSIFEIEGSRSCCIEVCAFQFGDEISHACVAPASPAVVFPYFSCNLCIFEDKEEDQSVADAAGVPLCFVRNRATA